MTKYYLKYDLQKYRFFIDVYESIKRSEKELKMYADAIESLAKSGDSLVFDTKDFNFKESYEYNGGIPTLCEIVGIRDSEEMIDFIIKKHNNSFRIPENVDVYMDGNYAKLKVRGTVEKTVSVNVSILEDVLKYFHPNIDGRHELKQEEILEKIKTLVK